MIGCSKVGGERQTPAFLADVRETVLLLHGSAGTSTIWRRIEETLQPLYRVITPDLIGYGGAALPEAPIPLPGREGVELIWRGVAWRFASEANREAFARDPESTRREFGGYDAGAAAEGRLVAADPTLFAIRDGRLYLFRGERSRARFEADASLAGKAEARWPELKRDLVRG